MDQIQLNIGNQIRVYEQSNSPVTSKPLPSRLLVKLQWIPESGRQTRTFEMRPDVIRKLALVAFQGIKTKLALKFSEYASAGVAVQSIVKNDLSDMRRFFFILPGDRGSARQCGFERACQVHEGNYFLNI